MSLATLLAVTGAFVSAFGIVVGATALGARWLGRADAERELAEAKKYAIAVDRDPRVVEYRTLRATTAAYRGADRPVAEAARRGSEMVDGAADAAAARSRSVQVYGERLDDAERAAARLPDRLDRPRPLLGAAAPLPASIGAAVERARRTPPAPRSGPEPPSAGPRPGRGTGAA
ncbi:hypothetical protein J0910_18960 [Nocardiopsis sp. CNT-189]|uniref:hypothetical protein n=1 Tax=Nocardiopsis oceanisediminis TaxID=2816862 RepID=UPI003B2F475A